MSLVSQSSIRALATNGTRPLAELIRGETSLGSFFEYRGYPAVPSNMNPDPGYAPYYATGYTIETHGSSNQETIDAIMLECNGRVIEVEQDRMAFAEVAAEVLDHFTQLHYFNAPVPAKKLVLNEVLFDVPRDHRGSASTVVDVNADGVGSVRGDQFVEVANAGDENADLAGVEIILAPNENTTEQLTKSVFTFPGNTVLRPMEIAVVFGGLSAAGFGLQFSFPRKDFAIHRGYPDSGFCFSGQKLSLLSEGDGIILMHRASNTVFDEVVWGNAAKRTTRGRKLVGQSTVLGDSIAGSLGESVVRSPDFTGLWTRHSRAYGTTYSPGTTGRPPGGVLTSGGRPTVCRLLPNFPNPFNPRTSIAFDVSDMSEVTLTVYDILGREVSTVVKNIYPSGSYMLPWNGGSLPSGVYFYRLHVQGVGSRSHRTFVETRRMMMVK